MKKCYCSSERFVSSTLRNSKRSVKEVHGIKQARRFTRWLEAGRGVIPSPQLLLSIREALNHWLYLKAIEGCNAVVSTLNISGWLNLGKELYMKEQKDEFERRKTIRCF